MGLGSTGINSWPPVKDYSAVNANIALAIAAVSYTEDVKGG